MSYVFMFLWKGNQYSGILCSAAVTVTALSCHLIRKKTNNYESCIPSKKLSVWNQSWQGPKWHAPWIPLLLLVVLTYVNRETVSRSKPAENRCVQGPPTHRRGPPGPALVPPCTQTPSTSSSGLPPLASRLPPPTSLRSAQIFIICYRLGSHDQPGDLRMKTRDVTEFHGLPPFLKIKPERLPEKEVGEVEAETRRGGKVGRAVTAACQRLRAGPLSG